MKTYTEVIEGNNIYDLLEKVYALASHAVVFVYIDVRGMTATVTHQLSEYNPEAE